MTVRRSPWINDRTSLLLAHLGEHELTLPEEAARQLISDHVDSVAARMRIGRQAARYYVTDDVIKDLAAELMGTNVAAGQTDSNVVSIVEERNKRNRPKR